MKKIKPAGRTLTRLDRAAERTLQLPATLCTGEPTIELFGNKQLIIDGCRGIMEYEDGYVKLSGGRYALIITGSGLLLKNLTESSCTVTGHIDCVEFGV